MPKKETRYGAYVRRKIKNPLTGEYQAVYGRTVAEREEKIRALQDAWARELETAESPYFYQYAAAWFARVSPDMSPDRRRTIAREINSNICPVIGAKRLREISSDDVMDVMAARTARSASARKSTLQTLKRILDAAEDAGKISRSPARKVQAGGKKPGPPRALSPEQEAVLMEAVEGQRIRLFVILGLCTGLRREELCGLQWRDVHLAGKAPHLDVRRACRWPDGTRPEIAEYLKSDAGRRTVPLPERLAGELTAARAALGDLPEAQIRPRCLCGNPDGTPWSLKQFQNAWRVIDARSAGTVKRRRKDPATGKLITVTVEKKLGEKIPNHPVWISIDFEVTPHTLRRTYITRLILGGVDLKRVQYLAGHESPDVTLKYYTALMDHRPEDLIGDIREIFDK